MFGAKLFVSIRIMGTKRKKDDGDGDALERRAMGWIANKKKKEKKKKRVGWTKKMEQSRSDLNTVQ